MGVTLVYIGDTPPGHGAVTEPAADSVLSRLKLELSNEDGESSSTRASEETSSTSNRGGDPESSTRKTWKVEIAHPERSVASGTLSDKGNFRRDGIDPGTANVRFADLDGRESKKTRVFANGAVVELFRGAAQITAGPYTVKQGDHISPMAHHGGFLSFKNVGVDGKNASGKSKRYPKVPYQQDLVEVRRGGNSREAEEGRKRPEARIPIFQTTCGDGGGKRNFHPGTGRIGTRKGKGPEPDLKVGHPDAVEELTGQAWRLNHSGYRAGEPEEFHCNYGLTVDGICGQNTQSELGELHES